MPRQNRVAPDGTLVAVPDRGLFWENRGALHDTGAPWLVHDGALLAWTLGGYRDRVRRDDAPTTPATVITPATVRPRATGRSSTPGAVTP